jgi:hypothetical protein
LAGFGGKRRAGGRFMVADKLIAANTALEEVADLSKERLLFYRVLAIVPGMLQKHGKKGYHEESGVNVGYKIGFGVGVVGEDGLFFVVSFHALTGIDIAERAFENTYAR